MLAVNRSMLGDKVRNQAYYDALKQVIVPGETVVADIGSGTGFLSFLAAKLGAKECYLFEQNEAALRLSKRLAVENGLSNLHFVPGRSQSVTQSVQADVVVSEILGHYALEEHVIEALRDARRFLKPGGHMIPGSLRQFVAPVIHKTYYENVNVWDSVGFDLTFSHAKRLCFNNMYCDEFAPEHLLLAQCWDTVSLLAAEDSARAATVHWEEVDSCTLYGFAMWWEAELGAGITLSTSPTQPATHWQQVYLPLLYPMQMKAGQQLSLTLQSNSEDGAGVHMEWSSSVSTKNSVLQTQTHNTYLE